MKNNQALPAPKKRFFYKLIYATTANLLSRGGIKSFISDERSLTDLAKKAKMFLLAKNDASEKISDTELSPSEQDTHRGNNMDVIQKLKTKRLSNVLKVFIVLVLYMYSQKRLNDIKGANKSSSGGSRKTEEGGISPKIEGDSELKLDNIQKKLISLSREPGRVVQNGFSKKFGKKGERGWKIHVSPKANYVIDVVEVLFEIEKKYKCVDKFVMSIDQYKNLNGSQAGKFITIYPISDDIAAKIAKDFHSELTKKGLTSDSCFINIKNDFKIYPGIYTRFCNYNDGEDKDSREKPGIPKTVLASHLKDLGKTEDEYEHPFESLSFGGVKLGKKVVDIEEKLPM